MKLKNVIISEANGEYVAVNVGGEFNGMIKMNETAAFIAKQMKNDISKEDLIKILCSEYEISEDEAEKSIEIVVKQLDSVGFIEL